MSDRPYRGPIPALDLTLQSFDRTYRGAVRVIGSWWLDQQGAKMPKPCLVLLHGNRPVRAGRTVPIVIHLDDVWKWAPDTADPLPGETRDGGPSWASRTIRDWLAAGLLPGQPENPRDRLAVHDAIADSLRDLIHMPPLPPRKTALVMGGIEVVHGDTGRTLDSVEF